MDDPSRTVRLFYSLLAMGDVAGALGLLDPAIEWTEAKRTPYFVGTMSGIDAVVSGLFEPLGMDFDSFTTVPRDFVTEGERVVAFGDYSGFTKRSGCTMSAPFVHLWTASNGRARRLIQYTDSAPWNEAITAPSGK